MPKAVDTTNTDPKYWDKVLKDSGLSMSRGLKPSHSGGGRRHRGGRGRRTVHADNSDLVYVGGLQELEALRHPE